MIAEIRETRWESESETRGRGVVGRCGGFGGGRRRAVVNLWARKQQ